MNTKRFLILSALMCLVCCGIHAQQPYIDLLGVEYYRLPEKTNFTGDDQKVNTSWFKASIQAPIKIKDDYLLIQPSYEQYSFDASPKPFPDLYGISLPLTYIKQWNNKQWQTAFVFIPRLSSDLKNISSDDYQLGGAAVAIYKKRSDLDYKFGLYYNSEYFGPFFIPLLGVDWKMNDRFTLFGLLPLSMNLEYKARENLYGGVALFTITNSYRLANSDWIRIADNHLKVYIDYYLSKNVVLTGEAGYSVLRKYTYGADEGSRTTNMQLRDGPLFKVGVAFRMRLDGVHDQHQ